MSSDRTYNAQRTSNRDVGRIKKNGCELATMDHMRIEIWDHIYRSGPQSREQIADSLRMDVSTVAAMVEHAWFEILDAKVQIATEAPPPS